MGDMGPDRLMTPRNALEDMFSRVLGATMQNMPGMDALMGTVWGQSEGGNPIGTGNPGQGPGPGGQDPNNPLDPNDPNYQGFDAPPAPGGTFNQAQYDALIARGSDPARARRLSTRPADGGGGMISISPIERGSGPGVTIEDLLASKSGGLTLPSPGMTSATGTPIRRRDIPGGGFQPGQPNGGGGGGGGGVPGPLGGANLIQNLISQFSLPGYSGPMGAGIRPEQTQALDLGSQGVSGFNQGRSNGIMGILQQMAQGGGPGTDLMRSAAGGVTGGYQNLLSQLGTQDPTAGARSALERLLNPASGEMDAQNILRGIATSSQGGPDFANAFSAMDAARRTGLGRDVRDLREMFSMGGGRYSSDLANSVAARQGESEKQFNSDMAQLILQATPSMSNSRIQAASNLGSLAGGARGQSGELANIMGQLGLGSAGTRTGALSSAAGLSLQDVMRQLQAGSGIAGAAGDAAGLLPGAQQGLSLLPGQVAQQGFNLGEAARGIDDTNITRLIQEFQRTSGAFLPALMSYAGGAPIITSPGTGQQALGALSGIGASMIGGK